jgi:5-formyltetrahydrofolate cyclo-ligase
MKEIARMQNLAKRNSLPAEKLEKKSALIGEKLLALPEFQKAEKLMLYFSIKNEVGTRPLIKECLKQGKQVFLPKTEFEKKKIILTQISSIEEVKKTRQGLFEPIGAKTAKASELDLIVVPGVAFDREGNRIGMGRGFYDELLRKTSTKVKLVGLCFEENLAEEVPTESHDVKMNLIVTDKQVIRIG